MAKAKLNFVSSINKAIEDVTKEMTAALRDAAKQDHWQPQDIKALKINTVPEKVSGKTSLQKFKAHHNTAHTTFASEFGDESTPGRHTVTRFMNASEPWMKRTAKLVEKKAFGKK